MSHDSGAANGIDCGSITDAVLHQLCEKQVSFELQTNYDMNNFFLLFCSTMVLFMEAGFAMLSVGVIRPKNFQNMLMSIMLDFALCGLAYYTLGFGLMFGEDKNGFIGGSHFVGLGIGSEQNGDYSLGFYLINFLWASVRATIVTGAVAERANFYAYGLLSFYGSLFVYPVVVHWVFGGGFLTLGRSTSLMSTGVADWAACGPIHMLGGLTGAVLSKVMGPRIGRFNKETGEVQEMHNSFHPALAALGTFILWTGWLGFNPGSAITLTGGRGVAVTRAAINSLFSSCTATLSSVLYARYFAGRHKLDTEIALNGCLTGLVSVTGCCAYVELWAALCIGLVGGIVYVVGYDFVLHRLKIDDPLGATAVHVGGGVWGLIAGAFFANPVLLLPFFKPPADGFITVPSGVFYGGQAYMTLYADGTQSPGGSGDVNGALVANAVVLILSVFAWVVVTYTPFAWALNRMGWLRASEDTELHGMDFIHGEDYEPLPSENDVHKPESSSSPAAPAVKDEKQEVNTV